MKYKRILLKLSGEALQGSSKSTNIDPAVLELMLARIALVCLVVATAPASAGPAIEIHASCAADIATDPAHVRILKSELAQALAGASEAHSVDISLVKLYTQTESGEVIVRAEVRAFVSDPKGRIKFATTAHATARGSAKERILVTRDAVGGAAHEVGRAIHDHHDTDDQQARR